MGIKGVQEAQRLLEGAGRKATVSLRKKRAADKRWREEEGGRQPKWN